MTQLANGNPEKRFGQFRRLATRHAVVNSPTRESFTCHDKQLTHSPRNKSPEIVLRRPLTTAHAAFSIFNRNQNQQTKTMITLECNYKRNRIAALQPSV